MTDIERVAPASTPTRISQATAIEQSRAVAEVQAAVIVAQQNPRSLTTARTAMQESCQMIGLAEKAFYRYPKAGKTVSGPSVHLARELARCWGNTDYGMRELRRDDDHGDSEMQAWAWDQQTNTRSSNTFIVPHKRDKQSGPVRLTDMRDIYENNANMGARRLREAIFSVMPSWFTEEAIDTCQKTLAKGDGKPLEERIAGAVKAFDGIGVTEARLEQKLGRDRDKWTAYDIAQLLITFRSIERGEVVLDDEFPPAKVTAAEIGTGEGEAAATTAKGVDQRPPTDAMVKKLFACLSDINIGEDQRHEWAAKVLKRETVESFKDLTRDDVSTLIEYAETEAAMPKEES